MKNLKIWMAKREVGTVRVVTPEPHKRIWQDGETRHCEISHIVCSKKFAGPIEIHLTSRGLDEYSRRKRAEDRAERALRRYKKSKAFRRLQELYWEWYVMN